jgi:hypothetical protein
MVSFDRDDYWGSQNLRTVQGIGVRGICDPPYKEKRPGERAWAARNYTSRTFPRSVMHENGGLPAVA